MNLQKKRILKYRLIYACREGFHHKIAVLQNSQESICNGFLFFIVRTATLLKTGLHCNSIPAGLVKFTEEILHGKLYFLSVNVLMSSGILPLFLQDIRNH